MSDSGAILINDNISPVFDKIYIIFVQFINPIFQSLGLNSLKCKHKRIDETHPSEYLWILTIGKLKILMSTK